MVKLSLLPINVFFYFHKSIFLIFNNFPFTSSPPEIYCPRFDSAASIAVQFSGSVMSDSLQPLNFSNQVSLSITHSWSLFKLMSVESVMPSNYLILCYPLLLLPLIFPSIRVFSKESALCIRWPKYWSFSFNISPSNEYSELTSFRIDWMELLAVRGTLKSLLQHHSSKASVLQHSLCL